MKTDLSQTDGANRGCSQSPGSVSLSLWALCDPIGKHLDAQGLTATKKAVAAWQAIADALTLLNIRGVIPYSAITKGRQKLVKMVARGCSPNVKDQPRPSNNQHSL